MMAVSVILLQSISVKASKADIRLVPIIDLMRFTEGTATYDDFGELKHQVTKSFYSHENKFYRYDIFYTNLPTRFNATHGDYNRYNTIIMSMYMIPQEAILDSDNPEYYREIMSNSYNTLGNGKLIEINNESNIPYLYSDPNEVYCFRITEDNKLMIYVSRYKSGGNDPEITIAHRKRYITEELERDTYQFITLYRTDLYDMFYYDGYDEATAIADLHYKDLLLAQNPTYEEMIEYYHVLITLRDTEQYELGKTEGIRLGKAMALDYEVDTTSFIGAIFGENGITKVLNVEIADGITIGTVMLLPVLLTAFYFIFSLMKGGK